MTCSVSSNLISEPSTLIDVRLNAIRFAARDINLYEFCSPDGRRLPAAEPGAHIDIHLPNGVVRQYSLTDADTAPTRYIIAVKRDPSGRGGSKYIHDELRVGTVVRIGAPRNCFPLVEAAHTILIAGGIGITPIWCMIQRLNALGRTWTLHYSCRSRSEAAFVDALAAYRSAHLNFDDESGGKYLDLDAIARTAPANAHLYCCGPTPMLKAFEAATAAWPAAQVHCEYFAAPAALPAENGFVIELARSGREFVIPSGSTIVDVLREAGIEYTTSCEQGICGTCATRVLAGEPDHRDMVLTDAERATNTTIMICCSGSRSERLILDI